jgi:hypothetical protein
MTPAPSTATRRTKSLQDGVLESEFTNAAKGIARPDHSGRARRFGALPALAGTARALGCAGQNV